MPTQSIKLFVGVANDQQERGPTGDGRQAPNLHWRSAYRRESGEDKKTGGMGGVRLGRKERRGGVIVGCAEVEGGVVGGGVVRERGVCAYVRACVRVCVCLLCA